MEQRKKEKQDMQFVFNVQSTVGDESNERKKRRKKKKEEEKGEGEGEEIVFRA